MPYIFSKHYMVNKMTAIVTLYLQQELEEMEARQKEFNFIMPTNSHEELLRIEDIIAFFKNRIKILDF